MDELDSIFDPYKNAYSSIEVKRRDPGFVTHMLMASPNCLWDQTYPECPNRFLRIFERLGVLGFLREMVTVAPRMATEDEILELHTERTLAQLKATDQITNVDSLETLSSRFDAIYIHPDTYNAALIAAGSTIKLVDQIVTGKIPCGFALVRPPGHHAMTDEYCGYCFFNNVALAAKHALEKRNVKRILIVDWDVHHGQGTQQMFYTDPRVVYFSIHRYEHGAFWPNLRQSEYDYVGEGKGAGRNFNVPLNKTGMTNADYMAIFHNLLLPMANEFQPELIIISAGYDAALGCPEGEMKVTPACYAHLLWALRNLACGKVAVVLEGGYCLDALEEGAALTVRSLMGYPCPPIGQLDQPCSEIVETILNTIHAHRTHWHCFLPAHDGRYIVDLDVHLPPKIQFLGMNQKPLKYDTRDCYPVQSETFVTEMANQLSLLKSNTTLSYAPHKVCYVYNPEMMSYDPECKSQRFHPEDPARIQAVFHKFTEFGLTKTCHQISSRDITTDELELVHDASYIADLFAICGGEPSDWRAAEKKYHSISFSANVLKCAFLAAGSLIQVVDEVMSGSSQSGVAIIRPPGHHASHDTAHGFCFFNNVALAAKNALVKHSLDRILIIDWDVHHGNGTQQIFYEDPRILYISLHIYDGGKFFPQMECARADYVGNAAGKGFNVNIPWNKHGVGDADYLAAFHNIILPIAYQYDPQLVIVSAGFDAAINDSIGKCHVTPEAFGHMTHYLSALANGKVVLALEGGYNKESVAMSMTMCAKALCGDPMPSLAPNKRLKEADVLQQTMLVQRKYWSCLQFAKRFPRDRENNAEKDGGRGDTL